MRAEKRRPLLYFSWEQELHTIKYILLLCVSINDCESSASIDVESSKEILNVGKFTNTESSNEGPQIWHIIHIMHACMCVIHELYLCMYAFINIHVMCIHAYTQMLCV